MKTILLLLLLSVAGCGKRSDETLTPRSQDATAASAFVIESEEKIALCTIRVIRHVETGKRFICAGTSYDLRLVPLDEGLKPPATEVN